MIPDCAWDRSSLAVRLRSHRLLRSLLSEEQWEQLWSLGATVDERNGHRLVLDLVEAAVMVPDHGVVVELCVHPDDRLCLLDRLVTKLIWARADWTRFRADANDYMVWNEVAFEGWLDRRAHWVSELREDYEALDSLGVRFGEAAVAELAATGRLVWRHGRLTVVATAVEVVALDDLDGSWWSVDVPHDDDCPTSAVHWWRLVSGVEGTGPVADAPSWRRLREPPSAGLVVNGMNYSP